MITKEAYIILNQLPIGSIKCQKLLQYFDYDILKVFKQKEKDLIHLCGKKIAYSLINWERLSYLKQDLALAKEKNVRIITPLDEEYPQQLKEIYDPPLCLYLRGAPLLTQKYLNLAVIGSRKASLYAIKKVKDILANLCQYKLSIISGFAYGIDTIAHQVAVDNHCHTTAVLGHGLSHIYPKANLALYKKILDTGGTILSEFPMQTEATKFSFPLRNRIISGLSQGILIGQAHIKSGSLITAKQALEQNRDIFVIPGPISDDFAGSHMLIKNGANLIENHLDILQSFSELSFTSPEKEKNISEQFINLTKQEKDILQYIQKHDASSVDDLHEQLQVPTGELLSLLMNLELQGLIDNQGLTYSLAKI